MRVRVLLLASLLCSAACGGESQETPVFPGEALDISPSPILFGRILPGEVATETVGVENFGTSQITIIDVRLVEDTLNDPGGEEFFRGAWFEGTEIPVGGGTRLEVVYEPRDSNSDRGTLEIELLGRDGRPATYSTEIVALEPRPQLTSLRTVQFLQVAPGAPASRVVELKNSGTDDLVVHEALLGPNPDFAVQFFNSEAADDEAQLPVSIPPKNSIWYRVSFTPKDQWPSKSWLSFETNDPAHQIFAVEFSGNPHAPCLEVVGGPHVDFGATQIGETNTEILSVRNCDLAATVTIHNVEISEAAGRFRLLEETLPNELQNGERFALEAGQQAHFVLSFTPIDAAEITGELVISSDNRQESRVEVQLIGYGDAGD